MRLVRREKAFQGAVGQLLAGRGDAVLNKEGLFIYNSLSVSKVLGYQPEELMGQNAFAIIHEQDVEATQKDFQRCIETPDERRRPPRRVSRAGTGTVHGFTWMTVCKSFLDDPEIAGVVVNSRDVTERHRLEEQLRHSQKDGQRRSGRKLKLGRLCA